MFRTGRTAFCLETMDLRNKLGLGMIEYSKRLSTIYRQRLWEGKWDSWEEYLFDIKEDPSVASRLRRLYELMIEEHGFPPERVVKAGGWSRLAEVLPMLKEKQSAEKWLGLCERAMTKTDIRRDYHEHKHGTDMLSCRHENSYLLRICEDCGIRVREFEEEKLKDNK